MSLWSYSLAGPCWVCVICRTGKLGCLSSLICTFAPHPRVEPCSTQTPHLGPNTQLALASGPLLPGSLTLCSEALVAVTIRPWTFPGDFNCNDPHSRSDFPGELKSPGIFNTGFGPLSSGINPRMVTLILVHPRPSSPSLATSPLQTSQHLTHWIFTGFLFSVKCFWAIYFPVWLKTACLLLSTGLFNLQSRSQL